MRRKTRVLNKVSRVNLTMHETRLAGIVVGRPNLTNAAQGHARRDVDDDDENDFCGTRIPGPGIRDDCNRLMRFSNPFSG